MEEMSQINWMFKLVKANADTPGRVIIIFCTVFLIANVYGHWNEWCMWQSKLKQALAVIVVISLMLFLCLLRAKEADWRSELLKQKEYVQHRPCIINLLFSFLCRHFWQHVSLHISWYSQCECYRMSSKNRISLLALSSPQHWPLI